jgi:hypothetical protein
MAIAINDRFEEMQGQLKKCQGLLHRINDRLNKSPETPVGLIIVTDAVGE